MKRIQPLFLVFGGTIFLAANADATRWISRDPTDIPQHMERDPHPYLDFNPYTFVGNSPLNFIDPWGLAIYPVGFIGPLQASDQRGITDEQAAALQALLAREAQLGTSAAARKSSVTFGDDLIEPFNSSFTDPVPVDVHGITGVFSLDWFTDLRSFTSCKTGPFVGPGLYTVAKSVWHVTQSTVNNVDVGWPYQKEQDRNAVDAVVKGLKYSDIFNDSWWKTYYSPPHLSPADHWVNELK